MLQLLTEDDAEFDADIDGETSLLDDEISKLTEEAAAAVASATTEPAPTSTISEVTSAENITEVDKSEVGSVRELTESKSIGIN